MANLLDISQKTIRAGKMTKREIEAVEDSYKITAKELKLSENEVQMLKHDLGEIEISFAHLGVMVVGMIPGWGEPADATSAAIDFATGHPIAGTISAFCACPVAGWLGDIPLLGIRIYRIGSSTLKCGKTMFVIAKTGKRAEKIFVWMGQKVVEVSQQSKMIKVIQKNVFDPVSASLYNIFSKLEKELKAILKDKNLRMNIQKQEYVKAIGKMGK